MLFAFFKKRSLQKVSRRRPPRRFRLESLESRVCPTAVGVSLTAQTADASDVSVQGFVSGYDSSYQIALSGQVSANLSADSSGAFSYFGPASGLGTITATVTGSDGDNGQASTQIFDQTPQIEGLMAQATGQGKQVEISGAVSAVSPAGLTVTFSGSAGLGTTTTTTDANGNFDLVTSASQLGDISATVTDSWGVISPLATTGIMVNSPQIIELTADPTGQGKQVEVSGSVSASTPGGLTVTFSGSAGLAATSATTDSNGNFDLLTTASQLGEVDAEFTDVWGETSPVATTTLSVDPPQINSLIAVSLGNGNWQFSGMVSGPDPGDDTVNLSGIASGSATPDASGNFSVELYLGSDSPSGVEYAAATDIWGQTGPQATYSFFG